MSSVQRYTRSEMKEILRCSICLDVLTDPRSLPCLHTFCHDCLHDLPQTLKQDLRGVVCPLCQQFYELGEEKLPFITNEFINLYRSVSAKENQCSICENLEAHCLCVECNLYMCHICKQNHTSVPITQHHILLDENEAVSDVTRIPWQLPEKMPQTLARKACNIQTSIEVHREKVHCLEEKIMALEGHYTQVHKQLLKKRDLCIKQAHDVYDIETADMRQLQQVEADRLLLSKEKHCRQIAEKQRLLKSLNSKLPRVEKSIDQKTILLKSIPLPQRPHEDVLQNRQHVIRAREKSVTWKVLIWSCLVLMKSILLSYLWKEGATAALWTNDFRHLPKMSSVIKTLKTGGGGVGGGVDIHTLDVSADRLAVISSHFLWAPVPFLNYISVLSLNGTLQGEIHFPDYENLCPRVVVQVNDSLVMLGSNLGLFVVDIKGKVEYQVISGNIHDITKENDIVSVIDMATASVVILQYSSGKWLEETRFLTKLNTLDSATLVMYKRHIFICSYLMDLVFKYNVTTGALIQTLGVTNHPTLSAGALFHALISGVDKNGYMLFCDFAHHHIQLLNTQENRWTMISLHTIQYPRDLVVAGNSVFLLWGTDGQQKISRYDAIT